MWHAKLIEAAINGMLTSLDPHSSFLPPDDFDDMQVQTRGEFGGLGIEVTQEEGYIKVVSPMDGMRLLDKSTGQERRYSAGWLAPAAPADPAGGATIDAEARAAIASLIAALRTAGVFPAS